jgi:hypothetical protein
MQKIIFIPSTKAPFSFDNNRVIDKADTVGSSLMRACMPHAFMSAQFSDKINVCYSRKLPDSAGSCDIVIFVRDLLNPDIKESKRRGCITVYDTVDAVANFNAVDKFDILIACSKIHAEILSKNCSLDMSKIVVIDHLHTNVNRKKVKCREQNQRAVVGAVNPGLTAFLPLADYEDLREFSKNNEFDLKNVDFDKVNLSLTQMHINNLFECYDGIHIGLALFNENNRKSLNDLDRVNQKPSTKVSGYAAYDIPVVCTYQRSYDEILQNFPDFKNYIAQDIEHAKSIILRLVQDYDYYMESRSLFHDIGEMFHMDHSYDKYVTQINNAAKMM